MPEKNYRKQNILIDPIKIIEKYYNKTDKVYCILIEHSKSVTKLAVKIATNASHLNPDIQFIKEAAMLHDIGIFLTNAKKIGCFGQKKYIEHGYLGRQLLDKLGLHKHALVCERHVGVGISIKDIEKQNLPLPKRQMMPITIEEEIICFADKFFSKNPKYLTTPKPVNLIKKKLIKHGKRKVKIFDQWIEKFNYCY